MTSYIDLYIDVHEWHDGLQSISDSIISGMCLLSAIKTFAQSSLSSSDL